MFRSEPIVVIGNVRLPADLLTVRLDFVTKNFAALAGLILVLSVQRPQAQGAPARIYFVDIGTGAGTLIVSPTGTTLLVDGGPPGAGTTKIIPTLDALGIAAVDYTVLTHYHIDHDAGLTEIIAAGRVGGIAYDNGDAPGVIPPSLTGSTGRAYTAYKNAIAAAGVVRATIAPGQVIDLGGGMRATCLVVGGRLLGGGSVPITNEDLNSEAISLLVGVQRLRLHRVGRPHRRRQYQHRESAGRRKLGRSTRRRRGRRATQPSRQHDSEQPTIPQRPQG